MPVALGSRSNSPTTIWRRRSGSAPSFCSSGLKTPSVFGEQRRQKMQRRDLRVVGFLGALLGASDGFLGLDGQFLKSHLTNGKSKSGARRGWDWPIISVGITSTYGSRSFRRWGKPANAWRPGLAAANLAVLIASPVGDYFFFSPLWPPWPPPAAAHRHRVVLLEDEAQHGGNKDRRRQPIRLNLEVSCHVGGEFPVLIDQAQDSEDHHETRPGGWCTS